MMDDRKTRCISYTIECTCLEQLLRRWSIDFDDYSDLLSPQQHLWHVSLQGLHLSLLPYHRFRDTVCCRLYLDCIST